jgi:hypothetical protein
MAFRREDAQSMHESGRLRPADHLIEVGGEGLVCQVAVRIDHAWDSV